MGYFSLDKTKGHIGARPALVATTRDLAQHLEWSITFASSIVNDFINLSTHRNPVWPDGH
jgi:hypothetical protein